MRSVPPGARIRIAPLRRLAAGLLAATALACGCSSGSKDTCHDVSTDICDALNECGRLGRTFDSVEQCVSSFNGLWEVGNRDDAACREEWELVRDLTCDQLATYFQL